MSIIRTGNPDPYNHRNPPPSREAAIQRLDETSLREQSILAQIENGDPNDFDSDEAWQVWKGRAVSALGHVRAEQKFLSRWVNGGESESEISNRPERRVTPAGASLMSAIQQMANAVQLEYHPMFSPARPPNSIEEARSRGEIVGAIYKKCSIFFSNIGKEAEEKGIGKDQLTGMKKSLSRIYEQMKAEQSYLNAWLRDRGASPRIDTGKLLLALADRLVKHGIALDPQEEKDVRQIREMFERHDREDQEPRKKDSTRP